MLRKCLAAGMAFAIMAGSVPSISSVAWAGGDDDDHDSIRYYIVRAADGTCRVRRSQRHEVLGQYRSMAGAERALAVKRTIGEC